MYGHSMGTPLYQVIRSRLEDQIRSGHLGPGTKLPTEAQLQKDYDVSRSVAQHALNELAQAGLVDRQKGRGTRVTTGSQQLNLLKSIDPTLGDAGVPGYLKVISAKVIPASDAELSVPELGGDDPVNQLVRVRYATDGHPLGVEVSITPFRLAPRLLDTDLQTTSIRAYLASQGIALTRSRMYLDPVSLENPYAKLINLDEGTPVLRRRRHMWHTTGDTAELTLYYMQPNEISFYIEYSEPPPRSTTRY